MQNSNLYFSLLSITFCEPLTTQYDQKHINAIKILKIMIFIH